jgi:hypothetical protein
MPRADLPVCLPRCPALLKGVAAPRSAPRGACLSRRSPRDAAALSRARSGPGPLAVPPRSAPPLRRLFHCSIELLYYRTSVPSNERLVGEADVDTAVARHRQTRGRPRTLQLVADHGRLVDPAFVPREPIWVARASSPGAARLSPGETTHRTPGRAARERASMPAAQPGTAPRHSRAPGGDHAVPPARRAPEASPGRPKPAARGKAPLRLTRRGRLAVTSTVVLLIAAGSMAASMAAAGGSRAGAPAHQAARAQAAVQAAPGVTRG